MIEVEVKLQIEDVAQVEESLLENGFVKFSHQRERDTYFDNEKGEIRGGDKALRVREIYDFHDKSISAQLNFKGPKMDTKTVTRPEYETFVTDPKACRMILESLGYEVMPPEVVKERIMLKSELFKCWEGMTACLDKVYGLGEFLELEIVVKTEEEKGQALGKIEKMLTELGYSLEDSITTSYLSMLQRL